MTTRNVPNLPGNRMTAATEEQQVLVEALGAAGLLPHDAQRDLLTSAGSSSLATSAALAKALADAIVAHGADTDLHASAETIAIAAYASDPALPADLTEVQNNANE